MDDRSDGDFLAAGTRLEEFEIEGKLGSGGFGVTYRAHDHLLDRRVAIKEYLPRDWGMRGPDGIVGPLSATHAKDYQRGLKRFLKEARALARLRRHAHILQVHRVFEARGTAYMVMEYVKGRSLAEALREEEPWTEARVLALLDALTAGLATVHDADLVHGDVKPANVMLQDDDSPVLIDFGAVRQAAVGRSGSLQPVLTPGYAPIEQYSEKGVLGSWTDVYALGAVAYEALSGRVPDEAIERASDDTLRPVSEVASRAVSPRLSSAVMSALALRRQDRSQSMAEWRTLLPLADSKPEPPETGPWWLLDRAAALVTLAVAVVSLVAWCGGESEPESAGTVPHAPVEGNAVGAVLNDGGGPEAGVAGRADAAAVAPGAGAGNGADPSPASNETGSAPDDPTPEDPAENVFRDCDGCPYVVVIPAGEFMMGSPASEEGRNDDEGPQRRVTLRSFALGVTEVTFDEWDACVRDGGCNGYRPDDQGWGRGARPVINVNWEDAQAYVSWLSRVTSAAYRLPSESEWEYAARAGKTTTFHTGATISTDQANFHGNTTYRRRTTPVRTFAPNPFGLYDVHGNVLEWVEDCWHDYHGAPIDGAASTDGGICGLRVSRGGSWLNTPQGLRSALRFRDPIGTRGIFAGFRVARTLD